MIVAGRELNGFNFLFVVVFSAFSASVFSVFFDLISRNFFSYEFSLSIVPLFVVFFILYRDLLPVGPVNLKNVAIAIVCASVPFMDAVYPAYLSSLGDYPAIFFNVDSPFHLSQVIALSRSEDYPPASLLNLGVSYYSHYGTQLFASNLAGWTGVSLHFSYFLLLPLVAIFASFFAIYLVLSSRRSSYAKLIIILSPLFYFSVIFQYPSSISKVYQVQGFGSGFPHISIVLSLSLAWLLVCLETVNNNKKYIYLLFVIFPILFLLVKSSISVSVLIFVLCVFLRNGYKSLLVYGTTATVLFYLCSLHLMGGGAASFSYVGLLGKIELNPVVLSFLFVLAYLFVLVIRNQELFFTTLPYFSASIIPLFFIYSFEMYLDGVHDRNIYQFASFSGFWFAIGLSKVIDNRKALYERIVILLVFFVSTLPPLINRLYSLNLSLIDTHRWNEVVIVDQLASCLKDIPTEKTLLVVNDLAYPASDYRRGGLAHHVAAIFGHQMLAGNKVYERRFINENNYIAQSVLVGGQSHIQINGDLDLYGVIHRGYSFSDNYKRVVCETPQYMIVKY